MSPHRTSPPPSPLSQTPAAAAHDASARPPTVGTGAIVVATAGTDDADSALRLAHLLAGRTNADVLVMSVVQPSITGEPDSGLVHVPPVLREAGLRDREAAVAAQLERAGVAETGWPVEVVGGDPARLIATRARAADARLIVLGRTRLAPVSWHGAELARRLLRLTDVPVLVVSPGSSRLPRRVVLALDFTPYSIYAGQIALSIAAPDVLLHLVHVRPEPMPLGADAEDWARDYDRALQDEFARARAQLGGENGRQYECLTLAGDPATAITQFATAVAADLVVSASHGRGTVDRLFLGSVAAGLLHAAPCSVLCIPGSAVARAAQRRSSIAGLHTRTVPRGEWDATLAELSRRAAGRSCRLEVEGAALGAQHLADGLPFAGADYDAHGARVTLRLGALAPRGRHVAHAIPGVTQLDVLADERGAVHVLRIVDDEAQTLLTFAP